MEFHEQPTTVWQQDESTAAPQGGPQADVTQVGTIQQHVGTTQGEQPDGKKPRKKSPLSRRKLIVGGVAVGTAAAVGTGFTMAIMSPRGSNGPGGLLGGINSPGLSASTHNNMLPGHAEIGHLLRRAGFGATPAEVQEYTALGYEGAVDRLLNYQQVSDDDMEQRLKALNLDLNKIQDQQRWWMLRMAWTKRPLLEKMTLFWHGYLTSSYQDVGGNKYYMRMINQNQFLREHAFDTMDNLLLGITADPAMLFYLDLNSSRKNRPNENYARELMELFTLGLGHYSQQDVFQAAAALTGWHADGFKGVFNEKDHSTLNKTFLGQTGNFDYKDIVRILAANDATPWFLARKLFTFFAYENPSNDDLKPLVDAYTKSNHKVGEMMKVLLLSEQFRSTKSYRTRLKSPVEFVVGAYKSLNVQGNAMGLSALTTQMGQTLFDPPNVAGWPGDKVSSLWLNSGSWMMRLNYVDQLVVGSTAKTGPFQSKNLQDIINENKIDTPEHFVDYYVSHLLDGNLDQDRRTQLVAYFNQPDPKSRTMVKLTNGKSYPLGRVRGTIYLIMAGPEYQLN